MGRKTPLFELHQELGARVVDFGGWDMPVQYSSQITEHHAVRRASGVFDVSHMCPIDLKGTRVREFLQHLLANDVAKLTRPGKALYSCMLNEAGGVLDDLIVYFLTDTWFRLVVNAGTRDKDLVWIRQQSAQFDVTVTELTDLAMLAIQGPEARAKTASLLSASAADAAMALGPFFAAGIDNWFVARTGYTGEDGFEIMIPAGDAVRVWRELNAAGVASCGLGARDTLRLEAGMPLYGNELDRDTTPFEAGLGRLVSFAKSGDFVGRAALERAKDNPRKTLVGMKIDGRGIARIGYPVYLPAAEDACGRITSGTASPTLGFAIAMGYVPAGRSTVDGALEIGIRDQRASAQVIPMPFYRRST
jgi:aminomethyltransferase